MVDQVELQLADEIGNWQTIAMTVNVSAIIRARMDVAKRQFPGARVRAVDGGGRVVDLS